MTDGVRDAPDDDDGKPPITCPKCDAPDSGFANPGELAAHLIDAHSMAGLPALTLARTTFPHEEVSMPTPRKTTGTCGYCKRERPNHTKNCKLAGPGPSTAGPTPRPVAGNPSRVAKKPRRVAKKLRAPKPPSRKDALSTASSSFLITEPRVTAEIAALSTVAAALSPLDLDGRLNVLGCVCKLLSIDPTQLTA